MSAQSIGHIGFLARAAGRESDDPGGPPGSPAVAELLRQWRAAERLLADLEPGSDAWTRLQVDIDGLRQRYQQAFDALSHSDPSGSSA